MKLSRTLLYLSIPFAFVLGFVLATVNAKGREGALQEALESEREKATRLWLDNRELRRTVGDLRTN